MASTARNGRTSAENSAYARSAALSMTRDQQLAAASRARDGRRAKAAERILAAQGELEPGDLDREIDREIGRQMERARAAALTARRRKTAAA